MLQLVVANFRISELRVDQDLDQDLDPGPREADLDLLRNLVEDTGEKTLKLQVCLQNRAL